MAANSIINTARDPASTLDATATQPNGSAAGVSAPLAAAASPQTATQPAQPATTSAAQPTGIIASAQAPAPKVADYNDIASSYQSLFGRPPDTAGASYWQNVASTGNLTASQLHDKIAAGARGSDQSAEASLGNNGSLSQNWAQPGLNVAGVGSSVTWDPTTNQWVPGATPVPTAAPTPSVTGYTPAQVGTPTQWGVTGNQTVAGQLTSLMDPNSPLIQQARTQGLEMANERGLMNSSIGESAALNSAYQAALPVAQSDAAIYSKAAGYNADQSNQTALFNANAQNQAGQANLSAQTQQSIAHLQAQTQTNLAYLDAQTKTNLANLSNENQLALASVEAQYHTLMQSNASASDLFRQVTQNISTISLSKDLDGPAKQAAVDNQLQLLKNGMGINGALSNLNLSGLLDFSGAPSLDTGPATNIVDPELLNGRGG